MRAFCLAAALLATPLMAHAKDECRLDLGRGWPPATASYGSAVERLFAADARPALTLTRLPTYGAESGLLLIPAEGEGDWTLRYSQADQRVSNWSGGSLQLRIDQQPDVAEVPMPAALARRVVAEWRAALAALVPQETAASFHEADTSLFVVDGLRVSGIEPGCGPAALMMEQAELLIEAVDEGEKKRMRRWVELEQSLDQLKQSLAGTAD